MRRVAAAVAAILAFAAIPAAEARITRIEITRTEPAFGGQSWGAVGAYERLIGKAHARSIRRARSMR